jgi:uncharacterized lipoprotein YmbA
MLAIALPVIVALALPLGGCASNNPPMHYFTLSQVAPSQPPPDAATGSVPPPVRLAAVAMPPELDRQELVTHDSANQVHLHEFNRWAAPLDEQIRRTLSSDLAARVPVARPEPVIVDTNAPAPASRSPRRTLTVSLVRLDIDAQCAVVLDANWTLQGGGVQAQSGSEQISQPAAAGECPAAAAGTISQALASLADRLVPFIMTSTPPI